MTDTTDLAIATTGTLSASTMERLESINDRRHVIRENAKAPRTLNGYRSDWRQLQTWAADLQVTLPADPEALTAPVPVELVEAYVIDRTNPDGDPIAASSVSRHLSAIKYWHQRAGFVSPTDHPIFAKGSDFRAGVRRLDTAKKSQARPLYLDELTAAVSTLDATPRGVRNRALLLVGWWGAFRRSELVGIDRGHLTDDPEGVLVNLPKSKTDQEGAGRLVPLHYHPEAVDPVTALRAWMKLVEGDPVFVRVDRWGNVRHGDRINGRTVALVMKEAAASIGIDPDTVSGHSLRAGFVSESDRRGIGSSAVRLVTGHQSDAMLSTYTRPRSLFEQSAGAFYEDGS